MAGLLFKSIFSTDTRYTPLSSSIDGTLEQGPSSPTKAEMYKHESSSTTHENKRSSPFRINPRIISDATIGLSDGLTVPFALTAGLSALGDTNVVIYGGFAELIAGGISMGLGGYLGARSEAEAYHAALCETRKMVANDHSRASSMARSAFSAYDIDHAALDSMTKSLLDSPGQMVDFLMRFHHQLAESDYHPSRAYASGLTISSGYFFGGLVPLVPYLFVQNVESGFRMSVLVMVLALFVFGWVKSALLGERDRWLCMKNGAQMVVLGGVAAFAAMGCVKAIER